MFIILVVLFLNLVKKSRAGSDIMTCACLTACSCLGPGLCPGAFFPNERFKVRDLAVD